MAHRKVEVLQDAYTTFKNEVLESKMMVVTDIKASDLEITNLSAVKLRGTPMTMTSEATTDLVEALGIPRSFLDTLRKGIKDEKLISTIVRSLRGASSGLTIVYNKKMSTVTSIYKSGTKIMQDSTYFNTLEKIIAKTPGAYLRNISQEMDGSIKAILGNPKLEFQIADKPDEWFTSGMTLDLNGSSLNSSFFTERLTCSNGTTMNHKLCSRAVNVKSKIPEFLAAVTGGDYHIDSIMEFKARVDTNYVTKASLREMLKVSNSVDGILGKYAPELTRSMSSHHTKMKFGKDALDNKTNHKFLNTGITRWELINEITALSSRIEQNRLELGKSSNNKLQMLGGDLLFLIPDLGPIGLKQLF